MTRVVRNAALLCAAGILVASAALANVPDPAHSSVGNGRLTVEGTTTAGGTATDACTDGRCGDLLITVRDFANNVIAGSIVIADFTNCSDINISCDQVNATTGQTYLSSHKVQGTTNSLGQFTFKVQGAGPTNTATCGAANCAGTNAGVACATVYADGVPIGNLKVASYDVDRAGSPNGATAIGSDAAKVKQEQLNVGLGAASRARDDYDFSGTVAINDVALETQFALDQGLGTGSRDTAHSGFSTWPSGGTPAGFCP